MCYLKHLTFSNQCFSYILVQYYSLRYFPKYIPFLHLFLPLLYLSHWKVYEGSAPGHLKEMKTLEVHIKYFQKSWPF